MRVDAGGHNQWTKIRYDVWQTWCTKNNIPCAQTNSGAPRASSDVDSSEDSRGTTEESEDEGNGSMNSGSQSSQLDSLPEPQMTSAPPGHGPPNTVWTQACMALLDQKDANITALEQELKVTQESLGVATALNKELSQAVERMLVSRNCLLCMCTSWVI
jgi:hypothetical protein